MRLAITVLAAVATSCATPHPRAAWTADDDAIPKEVRDAARPATAALRLFESRLAAERTASIAAFGHAETVTAHRWHVRNARLAARVFRLKLGRTSHRPRDPEHAPPAWAESYVRAAAGRGWEDVPGFVLDLGGEVGVLVPVAARASCLSCHGGPGQLAPGVAEALAASYPQDAMTGFAPGEHLGFLWAIAPK